MIKLYNHLQAKKLNEEMQKAAWIISRTGYSTVMDIIKLKKKSILIPTPGQTEQEYLGRHLSQEQIAVVVEQNDFSLNDNLEKAKQMNYQFPDREYSNELQGATKNLLRSLRDGSNK
jgi:predicted glycosyltransferase